MLPRSLRLAAKRQVALVYQRGARKNGSFLSLRLLPNRQQRARAAVVVSKSVAKKATDRNRAKRVLRALLGQVKLPAADMVVSVRRLPPPAELSRRFQEDLVQWFPG